MAMIKRAICKAKRIDVQKERKKKKMSKIRMRRIPSGFSKARMIVSEARLLAAINASSFLKHLAIHIRSENKPLGNHTENKSTAGLCIIIQRAHSTAPKLLLCNSARAPLIYSFYIIAFRHRTRHSFDSLLAMRKVIIIGRVRDNNTYV